VRERPGTCPGGACPGGACPGGGGLPRRGLPRRRGPAQEGGCPGGACPGGGGLPRSRAQGAAQLPSLSAGCCQACVARHRWGRAASRLAGPGRAASLSWGLPANPGGCPGGCLAWLAIAGAHVSSASTVLCLVRIPGPHLGSILQQRDLVLDSIIKLNDKLFEVVKVDTYLHRW
jgi:hypothetical protein